MSVLPFRKQIYIVLIISILFRFGFLFFGDILPVMWDARRYVGASIGLISYVDDSGDVPFQTPLQDRIRFQHYTDKYIQGEQIEWLKYKPFSLTEARNEIFIGGPLYPALCAIVMVVSPGNDFTVLRVMNIVLDIFVALFVMLIACKFIGKRGALISGMLYALYFPFTLLTSMMLLETSTTLLMLILIYYLLKAFYDDKNKYYLIAGIASGLLILNKPTALLLAVPVLISFYWYTKDKIQFKMLVRKMSMYFISFMVITICWAGIASYKYGELTFRDPSYKEANLRQSSNITFEGYDLDKVEKDFWEYSIKEHILGDPVGYAGLLVKKIERMWSKSANDFKKNYIVSAYAWEVVHLCFCFVGLIGLILLTINNSRVALWILMVILYYSAIHIIFHSVSRYSFNALPLLFIASAYLIDNTYLLIKSKKSVRKLLLISLLGIMLLALWKTEYLNSILHLQLTELKVFISVIVMCIICFLSLYIISKLFIEKQTKLNVYILPIIVSILFLGFSYSTVLSRNSWSEFKSEMSDSQMKAGSRIYIDQSNISMGEGMLAVLIDVNSGANRQNTFTVQIADSTAEYVGGKAPLMKYFYPKPSYRFYAQFEPIGLEQFRQYAIIPVEFDFVQKVLTEKGYLDISIAINDRSSEDNNYINLYGNFETGESEHYIPGIRFTSVERHVHRGDPRIRYSVKYLSEKVISYYISRNSEMVANSTDLSSTEGVQFGRYNIFLVQFFPNGEFEVY